MKIGMGADTVENTAGQGSDDDFQDLFPKVKRAVVVGELASKKMKNRGKRSTKRCCDFNQGPKLHIADSNAALNERDRFLLNDFATQYICSSGQKQLETHSATKNRVDEKRKDVGFGSQLQVADSNAALNEHSGDIQDQPNDLPICDSATNFIFSKEEQDVLDPAVLLQTDSAVEERREDLDFGSQMNALLRLCSQAGRRHPNVQKSSEEGFSADNEDDTSLMTQTDTPIEAEEQPVEKEHYSSTSSCKRIITVLKDVTNATCGELKSSNALDKENKRKRCSDVQELVVHCPVCKAEIGDVSLKEREAHTNNCLDKLLEQPKKDVSGEISKLNAVDVSPVVKWLEKLNLSKYAPLFIKEEIDWDTLQWLTEEDLSNLGIAAFGPRKKIVAALLELKQGESFPNDDKSPGLQSASAKKYITDFFGLPSKLGICQPEAKKQKPRDTSHNKKQKQPLGLSKFSVLPQWMSIPGTKFRVDAFQHLTNDCSHWFLTHFHSDHYQGLTKGFRFGKIYCSFVTARLINLRIGIPWDRLHPLQLGERTKIDGVWVTLVDANHCPGAAMILFEPSNGKIVLHTGDFRFCDEMTKLSALISTKIHTLILDTTYCNPQYDFPKQETVVQFVIDAIQAESFNPTTLFLIGTYTLGKERLFLEVARVLQKKIYVGAVKRRMLACLDLSNEDMNWITTSDMESCIHVVPLWSIASFKRMASISKHYHGRFSTIVSFSPTGWNFGRGKKRTPGRRWQQGTIIRYEVPYSEHSSFTELKEFVKLISPGTIIPSVNNTSPCAAQSMIARLSRS